MESIDKLNNISEEKNKKWLIDNKEEYKRKIEEIINLDDIILIIYSLIESELINEDRESFYDLIELSTWLDEYNKMQVLYYLIENWVYFSSIYSEILKLDTSDINIEYFLEWIKNWWANLLSSEYFDDFISLYNNKNEILKLLWIEWFLEQYDYYLEINPELWKIKKEDTMEAVENFQYLFNYWSTLDKLNKYWLYDWNLIIENIFEDSVYAKKLLENIFTLNKKELQDLRNYKVDFLNYEYNEDLKDLIEDIESYNFSLLKEFSFENNDNIKDVSKELLNEILKITILKNKWNEFHILFTDITWRINNIELTSNIDKLKDDTNIYIENNNDFLNKTSDLLQDYIKFLNKNEFNFKIFIFKSTWKKDWTDYENNINYEWKVLKVA